MKKNNIIYDLIKEMYANAVGTTSNAGIGQFSYMHTPVQTMKKDVENEIEDIEEQEDILEE